VEWHFAVLHCCQLEVEPGFGVDRTVIVMRGFARVGSGWRRAAKRPRPHSISISIAAVAGIAIGCQGGYPIAATRCDEWCDQMRRVECGSYDPAACVAGCESAGVGQDACADLVEQALSCLKSKSDAELDCETWLRAAEEPCLVEQTTALECGNLTVHGEPGDGAPGGSAPPGNE
jgi:hypothetical protein